SELFSAPMAGGVAAVKLNGTLPTGGQVRAYEPTPDGQRAVFEATRASAMQFDIFSSAIDAANAVRVSLPPGSGSGTTGFWKVSADGSTVVYLGDPTTPGVVEAFSVKVAGGTVTRVNGALASDRDAVSFALSPRSDRIAYVADQDTNEMFEAYV